MTPNLLEEFSARFSKYVTGDQTFVSDKFIGNKDKRRISNGGKEKTKPAKFSQKKEYFLPLDTHLYECVGGSGGGRAI